MLKTINLTKIYSNGTCALNSINISAKKGLVCIIGPNGAGKTTLIKILTTQLLPTKGEAYLLGFDVVKEFREVRKRIAIVPQEAQPDPYMSPWEHVYWYLTARGASLTDAKERAMKAIRDLGLEELRDRQCGLLSGGEKRRVLMAMALATNSEVIVLDEPTVGLDPQGKRSVWTYLRTMVKSGLGVIVTTHHMEEVEIIGDTVILLHRGQVISLGSPDDFKKIVKYKFKILLSESTLIEESLFYQCEKVKLGDKLIVYLANDSQLRRISEKLAEMKVKFSVYPVGVEDAFIKLIEGKE